MVKVKYQRKDQHEKEETYIQDGSCIDACSCFFNCDPGDGSLGILRDQRDHLL